MELSQPKVFCNGWSSSKSNINMSKRRTIERVPKHWQDAVLEELKALGLDGQGEPIKEA